MYCSSMYTLNSGFRRDVNEIFALLGCYAVTDVSGQLIGFNVQAVGLFDH